ncbi:DUF262 domain-containing protein [Pectobacterium brasiliense]|uniref:DUF262 domain-containing protein n=1 Tax=Pectobacterium brasiliense TaxID=180957 RepID=UPI002A7EDC8D|nr:DUF262 domain-containing protein [Pectobacterium brasiliense]MDY4333764.1 DUF262 domain-containing protein [Pectobacterium brasiliense]
MSLIDEINKARLQVHTDSYPMSIGEMVNLYRDGDLDIHPEFQRVYRWSEEQKSKLIESILLGIPLPSIFVSQRPDGVWDVVDGLQRLSTIFSFLGELKKTDGSLAKPLELRATKYLPSLEGKVWDDPQNPAREVDMEIKRVFKREKLDIKIIKRESEGDTKFELFQRLNTGGSKLSDQEVRNCMLLMLNAEAFEWLQTIAQDDNFRITTPLSSKQIQECYAQELAFRLIVQRHYDEELRKAHSDVGPYLNAELGRIFSQEKPIIDYGSERAVFEKTFKLFNLALEDNSFKKFNHQKNRLEGAISIPVYEALATALSIYIEANPEHDETQTIQKINTASKLLTQRKEFLDVIDKSVRPLDRMIAMISIGKELIK